MIDNIQTQLDSDNSIVIQLVSTNEAAQEREFSRLQEQDLDLEDEEYWDDNGNLRSKPVYDREGNAVINRKAVRQKEMLLDKLSSIKVPASALDMIINHFGSDMVVENAGRKGVLSLRTGKPERKISQTKRKLMYRHSKMAINVSLSFQRLAVQARVITLISQLGANSTEYTIYYKLVGRLMQQCRASGVPTGVTKFLHPRFP